MFFFSSSWRILSHLSILPIHSLLSHHRPVASMGRTEHLPTFTTKINHSWIGKGLPAPWIRNGKDKTVFFFESEKVFSDFGQRWIYILDQHERWMTWWFNKSQASEENILFEPESRAVKLADFGSAKVDRRFGFFRATQRWTLLGRHHDEGTK